ncbi:hypothetical protein EMIT074MI3_20197 [Bacillus licheniformis]
MKEMKRRGSIDEPKVCHSVYFDVVGDVRARPKRRGLPAVFLTRTILGSGRLLRTGAGQNR